MRAVAADLDLVASILLAAVESGAMVGEDIRGETPEDFLVEDVLEVEEDDLGVGMMEQEVNQETECKAKIRRFTIYANSSFETETAGTSSFSTTRDVNPSPI
jgi:hypothetical protein